VDEAGFEGGQVLQAEGGGGGGDAREGGREGGREGRREEGREGELSFGGGERKW